ncbi:formylglycine-generating enzyme family protein [Breznakiellaceae bacterium SP9]
MKKNVFLYAAALLLVCACEQPASGKFPDRIAGLSTGIVAPGEETGGQGELTGAPDGGTGTPGGETGTPGGGTVTPVVEIDMVSITGGSFMMGSPENEPGRYNDEVQHRVTITKPFYMSKTEVTQKDYQALMGSNPSYFKGDNLPVESVSWYDAAAFCNALSIHEGLTPAYTINGTSVTWNQSANGYRLPTEAEWEYACRAGTTTPYSSGSSVDNAGWYYSNSGSKTHPVGTKQANAWGLYDMHGNVYEWCWDWYSAYSSGDQTDPSGAASGSYRVLRGGSWCNSAQILRSAYRDFNTPTGSNGISGFRLVRP